MTDARYKVTRFDVLPRRLAQRPSGQKRFAERSGIVD